MSTFIPPSQPKTQRALPPEDAHVARLYSMVNCGTFKQTGQFAKDDNGNQRFKNELLLTWELPEVKHVFDKEEGPQPFVVSQTYTFSLGEKANLRKLINSWRGKDLTDEEASKFDIAVLLGKPCLITVGHEKSKQSGMMYSRIMNVSKLPSAMTCPPAINPPISYHVEEGTGGNFEKLPEWIQKKVQQSEEWAYQSKNPSPQGPVSTKNNDPWTDENAADEMADQLEAKAAATNDDDPAF